MVCCHEPTGQEPTTGYNTHEVNSQERGVRLCKRSPGSLGASIAALPDIGSRIDRRCIGSLSRVMVSTTTNPTMEFQIDKSKSILENRMSLKHQAHQFNDTTQHSCCLLHDSFSSLPTCRPPALSPRGLRAPRRLLRPRFSQFPPRMLSMRRPFTPPRSIMCLVETTVTKAIARARMLSSSPAPMPLATCYP